MLLIQGSRDKLSDLAILRLILARLSTPITLHVIDEADHSFKLPRRAGRSELEVWVRLDLTKLEKLRSRVEQ